MRAPLCLRCELLFCGQKEGSDATREGPRTSFHTSLKVTGNTTLEVRAEVPYIV
jgi:hypothetical protein